MAYLGVAQCVWQILSLGDNYFCRDLPIPLNTFRTLHITFSFPGDGRTQAGNRESELMVREVPLTQV